MLKREESPLEALASAEKALVSLDVIRVFRPSSDEYGSAQELFGQGRKAREELSSGLSQRAISDLRNGFYGKAIAEIERVRQMHGETHGSSHEIERWRLLARFGQSLGEEEMLFREHILPVLAGDHSEHALAARPGVIQCLETGELESVRKQFWDMLQTAFNAQVLQLAFSQALEDARNALSAGRLFETMSHLGSARISLTAGGGHPASNDDEERESTAMTLFAKLYAEETGLLYIICEAEARSQDHQARELCGKHEFNQAKSVYDRIDRIRRLIPYELELEKAGLLAPRYFAMEQVGKLSRTAEESNKCLRTALGLMEQENFADAWNELNRGLSLASVGVPEEQPASLYWSGQARADLVGGLTKERERARLSLVLQQIIESPGLPEVLPAACLALEHLRQWEDRRESTWGARQHERIKQALKMEFDTRAGSFNLESIGILDLAKRYFVADNDIRSLLPQWESLLVGLFEKDVEALKQAGNVDKLRLPQDLTCMSKSLELTLDRYPSMLRLENVSAQSALLASKSKVTEMIDRVQGDIRKQRELRGEYEAARSRNLHHARAILDNARTVKLELYDSPEMSLASLTSEIEKELDQIDSLRKEDLFREAELAINNGQFELAKDFFERVSQEFDVSDWSREVDRRSDNLKNQSSRYEQLERKRHELESKLQIPISTWELGKLSELENANARLVSVQSECDEVLADWPRDLLSEQSVLHKSFANLSKTIRERRIAWFDCLLGLIEADLRARDWVSADEKYGFASAVSRGLYDTEDGASKLYRLNADIAVLRDRWLSRPSSEDQAAWEGLPTVEEGSLVEIAVGRLATLLALHATKTLEPTLEALESREAQRLDRLRAEVLYRDARDRAQKEPNAALDITNQAVELADHLSFAPWWKGAAEELQRGLKTQIDKANAGQTKRNDEEYRQLESQIRDLVQKGHYSEAKEKAESFRQLVSPRLEENLRSLRGDIEYFASVDSRFEALHGQSPSILIDLATSAKELDPHTKGWIEEYLAFHKDVTLKRLPAMLRDRIIEFDHSILENTKHKKTGDRMSARVRFKEFDDLKKQKPWEGE
ncbi:MAG: hypothetical protein M1570_04285 [Chloroflexi bacterium]|nr:hypothetical protein [Chloroflexota bacterium]